MTKHTCEIHTRAYNNSRRFFLSLIVCIIDWNPDDQRNQI